MYNPAEKNRLILERAMEHISSVPYKVSLRWVFYRLLQDGLYSKKDDYRTWSGVSGKARKAFYEGWSPDTFTETGRPFTLHNAGYLNKKDAKAANIDFLIRCSEIELDHYHHQERYVVIAFESATMLGQFQHHAPFLDLFPVKGDASITFKWKLAEYLERMADHYEKEITVLYFGDCDKKGKQIPISLFRDVRKWCSAPISVIRCGLHASQAVQCNLPEKLGEKAGTYEWEALSDEQAGGIIKAAVSSSISLGLVDAYRAKSYKATLKHRKKIAKALKVLK